MIICVHRGVCKLTYNLMFHRTESIGHISYVINACNFIQFGNLIHIHVLQRYFKKSLLMMKSTVTPLLVLASINFWCYFKMFSCNGVDLNASVNFIETDFKEVGRSLVIKEPKDTLLEQITIENIASFIKKTTHSAQKSAAIFIQVGCCIFITMKVGFLSKISTKTTALSYLIFLRRKSCF